MDNEKESWKIEGGKCLIKRIMIMILKDFVFLDMDLKIKFLVFFF